MWPSCFLVTRFTVSPDGYYSRPVSEEISALLGRSWEKRENPFLVALLQENPLFWEKPVLSLVLIGVGCHFLLFILYRFSGDVYVGKTLLGKKPLICWEKSLDSLLVLYQSSGDFCGFSRSLCSASRLLFSTLLGEISAPLADLRKFSAPSFLSLVLVGACVLFGRYNFRVGTLLGKNLSIRKTHC